MRLSLLAAAAVLFSTLSAQAETFTLCMLSSGSPPCPISPTMVISYEQLVNDYGGTVEAQHAAMGAKFCTFIDNGEKKLYPYSAQQTSAISGGDHGTGVWTITCATGG